MSELVEATPSAANAVNHADIVRAKAGARSLMALAADMYRRAQAGESVGALRERLLQRATSLADQSQASTDEFESYTLAELKNRPREEVKKSP